MLDAKLGLFFNTTVVGGWARPNIGKVTKIALYLSNENSFFVTMFDGETPKPELAEFMDTWGFEYAQPIIVNFDEIDELNDMVTDLKALGLRKEKGTFFSAEPVWSN